MPREKRRLGKAVLILLLFPIVLPLALAAVALYFLHKMAVYILAWALWLPGAGMCSS